jgi:hypothetical protein
MLSWINNRTALTVFCESGAVGNTRNSARTCRSFAEKSYVVSYPKSSALVALMLLDAHEPREKP